MPCKTTTYLSSFHAGMFGCVVVQIAGIYQSDTSSQVKLIVWDGTKCSKTDLKLEVLSFSKTIACDNALETMAKDFLVPVLVFGEHAVAASCLRVRYLCTVRVQSDYVVYLPTVVLQIGQLVVLSNLHLCQSKCTGECCFMLHEGGWNWKRGIETVDNRNVALNLRSHLSQLLSRLG